MRALLGDKRELAQKLASLETELKQRLDVHEAAIVTILQRVMDIIRFPLRIPQSAFRNFVPFRTPHKLHPSWSPWRSRRAIRNFPWLAVAHGTP